MVRGIPTEEVLTEMRESDPPICYLVGTPKGRLSQLEAQLLEQPWKDVRPGLEVKLLAGGEGTLHFSPRLAAAFQRTSDSAPKIEKALATSGWSCDRCA
jgi:hypothetical protein